MAGLVSEAHQIRRLQFVRDDTCEQTAVQPLIAEQKRAREKSCSSQRNSAFSYRCPQISQANRILGHPRGGERPCAPLHPGPTYAASRMSGTNAFPSARKASSTCSHLDA